MAKVSSAKTAGSRCLGRPCRPEFVVASAETRTKACPALITCAEGSRFSPRLGRSPVVLLDDVAGAGQ
jgi:hypothetical protein